MINWQQIDTVFLDMDGTLLDLHFDNYFWLEHVPLRYSEIYNVPREQAKEELVAQFEHYRGSLNWYCLDFWSETLSLDIIALKKEIEHKIAYRPNVKIFLQQLRENNKQISIVTDAHHDSIKLKLKNTSLDNWVDDVICSHDFKRPKQDPEFWSALQKENPFNLQTTLFIDDNLAVLRSAQSHGVKHLLAISQPDSQRPAETSDEFNSINDFAEIFPDETIKRATK